MPALVELDSLLINVNQHTKVVLDYGTSGLHALRVLLQCKAINLV